MDIAGIPPAASRPKLPAQKRGAPMNSNRPILLAVLVFVLGLLASAGLHAQAGSAVLRGQVTDPSGALVPGATVTLAGADAHTFTARSTAGGVYELKGLPAGEYTLVVEAPGFETYSEAGIELSAGR